MAEQQTPFKPVGRDYVCTLDEAVLPDGVDVHGSYDPDGITLIGVQAVTSDGIVVHTCGSAPSGGWPSG